MIEEFFPFFIIRKASEQSGWCFLGTHFMSHPRLTSLNPHTNVTGCVWGHFLSHHHFCQFFFFFFFAVSFDRKSHHLEEQEVL